MERYVHVCVRVVCMCERANVGESESFAIWAFQVERITAGRKKKKAHKTGTCDWTDIDTGGGGTSVRVDEVRLQPPPPLQEEEKRKYI